VFQWAQADVLAPIQAFVLGATWPSVVTRIMTGSAPAPGSLSQTPAPVLQNLVGGSGASVIATPPAPSNNPQGGAANPPPAAGGNPRASGDSTP
jgi:hypothetical protein